MTKDAPHTTECRQHARTVYSPRGTGKASCLRFLRYSISHQIWLISLDLRSAYNPQTNFSTFVFADKHLLFFLRKIQKVIAGCIKEFLASHLYISSKPSQESHSADKMRRLMDCLSCAGKEDGSRVLGKLPNDVRAVVFTSFFLNVLTLRGRHCKHIKPLWTLSKDFLMAFHIRAETQST